MDQHSYHPRSSEQQLHLVVRYPVKLLFTCIILYISSRDSGNIQIAPHDTLEKHRSLPRCPEYRRWRGSRALLSLITPQFQASCPDCPNSVGLSQQLPFGGRRLAANKTNCCSLASATGPRSLSLFANKEANRHTYTHKHNQTAIVLLCIFVSRLVSKQSGVEVVGPNHTPRLHRSQSRSLTI